ncbi:hypothetical protein DFP73DRAFT_570668 [Morchella snyderi]|nr:hypothetical protein DFP73DRAFT_570668 [Morchella snyderi]
MDSLNPFSQGASPPGSNPASVFRPSHENSPFGSGDSVVTFSTLSQRSPFSDRSSSSSKMVIDSPEVIDLTVDYDDAPAAQYPAIPPAQENGGGYDWETMKGSGGYYKVATSAGSDTERAAAGSSTSIGKMKIPVRATTVNQHTGPSPQESGTRPDAHTAREFDKIYGMISRLQQGQKIHDKDIHQLSTRMDITENNFDDIHEDIHHLSTRMDTTENNFKSIEKGISQLSTRIVNAENQLKEDARNREKQRREDMEERQRAEKNHEFRHGIVVGMLMKAPSRRPGYENPRNPKGSRGKRLKNRFEKTRRHSTPSTGTCTPNSTPTGSVWNTSSCNSPGVGVTEAVYNIKSEPTLDSTPATPSQHSPSPKRETSSGASASSIDNRLEGQSSGGTN